MNRSRLLILGTAMSTMVAACATIEPPAPALEPEAEALNPEIYNMSGLLTEETILESKFRDLLLADFLALQPEEIDSYQQRLEASLRESLAGTNLTVVRIDNYLAIRMPVREVFSMSGADIDPAAYTALTSIGNILVDFDQSVIEIACHTDDRNSASYNTMISSRRAESIASFLQALGVDAIRLIEVPNGAENPVSDGDLLVDRELNRRVELTLVPLREHQAEAVASAIAAE